MRKTDRSIINIYNDYAAIFKLLGQFIVINMDLHPIPVCNICKC